MTLHSEVAIRAHELFASEALADGHGRQGFMGEIGSEAGFYLFSKTETQ